jgi:hypothetical protein
MSFRRPALTALLCCLLTLTAGCDATPHVITLDADDLYNAYDARYVVPSDDGRSVRLDPRIFKARIKAKRGWIVTDPIDLRPTGDGVGLAGKVARVALTATADAPEGATVVIETRGSDNGLAENGWSDWKKLDGMEGNFQVTGDFLQVRFTLSGSADTLPTVSKLVIVPTFESAELAGNVKVVKSDIQTIRRSPIEFHYGRPDQADIVWFRKAARLDEVVAGKKGDFAKLVALTDHVGAMNNADRGTRRHREKGGHYCWDIRKLVEVGDDGKLTIHGHCMSYAQVLVTACTAMGYPSARHNVMLGFREASHEVVDVWVPDMGKWVYLDPSLTQFYFLPPAKQFNPDRHTVLNLIQMHEVVVDNFVPDGKDMFWFSSRKNEQSREMVRKVGGKKPIGARTGPWYYGQPMDPDYDWGWKHGYLAAGFVQMTPRNDFHSNPGAVSKRWEHYPGYSGYPNWVDAKTPPRRGGENWFTRKRDFYWTLDQATLQLVRTDKPHTLTVLLGNSMPHFKHYQLKVDTDAKANFSDELAAADQYQWELVPGRNTLTVTPVDQFGRRGLPSTVTVKHSK